MPRFVRSTLTTAALALLLVLGACGQTYQAAQPTPTRTSTPAPTNTPLPTATPVPPTHFVAQTSDQSWSFAFEVNATGTAVPTLMLMIPGGFLCPPEVFDLGSQGTVTPTTPWPITNGQFTLTHDISFLGTLTINGTLGSGAKTASGTWQISGGTFRVNCSGTWTAQA